MIFIALGVYSKYSDDIERKLKGQTSAFYLYYTTGGETLRLRYNAEEETVFLDCVLGD